jgi:hypothetical protein
LGRMELLAAFAKHAAAHPIANWGRQRFGGTDIRNWVMAGGRVQPVVLAFEDLHWADPTTLDVLRGLAERGALAPLLHYRQSRVLALLLPWPALALVNHMIDGCQGQVGLAALRKAIAFSRYLESHAHRIYSASNTIEVIAGKAILEHLRSGELEDGFTARDAHQHRWSNLTEHAWVQAGLELLTCTPSAAMYTSDRRAIRAPCSCDGCARTRPDIHPHVLAGISQTIKELPPSTWNTAPMIWKR